MLRKIEQEMKEDKLEAVDIVFLNEATTLNAPTFKFLLELFKKGFFNVEPPKGLTLSDESLNFLQAHALGRFDIRNGCDEKSGNSQSSLDKCRREKEKCSLEELEARRRTAKAGQLLEDYRKNEPEKSSDKPQIGELGEK